MNTCITFCRSSLFPKVFTSSSRVTIKYDYRHLTCNSIEWLLCHCHRLMQMFDLLSTQPSAARILNQSRRYCFQNKSIVIQHMAQKLWIRLITTCSIVTKHSIRVIYNSIIAGLRAHSQECFHQYINRVNDQRNNHLMKQCMYIKKIATSLLTSSSQAVCLKIKRR